jgi:hypothetical protein
MIYYLPNRDFPKDYPLKQDWSDWEVEGDSSLPISKWNRGFHLLTVAAVLDWIDEEIWEAEYDSRFEYIDYKDIIVCRRARLIRRVDDWNEKTARLFAVWCAEQVQSISTDPKVGEVIAIVKDYADGTATEAAMNEKIVTTNVNPFGTKESLAIGSVYASSIKDVRVAVAMAAGLAEFSKIKYDGISLRKAQIVRLTEILEGKVSEAIK